ncbi:MAG: UDP-glucose 4-epimerase GalE [Actinomycetota bacterium]|nr:UDP-glucose 4-epimerase GalE [Actinomycetota bacterium]
MTTWLVTGGAGYIGSHVVRELLASGRAVVVLDDLSSGHASRVPAGVAFVQADVADGQAVTQVLQDHAIDGVVHLAAKKAVGESVEQPLRYYRENVDGMLSLLEAMAASNVTRLVYSSSAAVYGSPERNPIPETATLQPESPYGETKVVGEWLAAAQGAASGLSWVALRYFNVAGAGSDDLGDDSVNNLIPMVFAALDKGESPQIFGDDYPTPDGTCIRDYIHVADLASAHAAAAAYCEAHQAADAFNVGRGEGSSVREVMNTISAVIGRDVQAQVAPRRMGDPPASTAATEQILLTLGWKSQLDLEAMVASAWSSWSAHRSR